MNADGYPANVRPEARLTTGTPTAENSKLARFRLSAYGGLARFRPAAAGRPRGFATPWAPFAELYLAASCGV